MTRLKHLLALALLAPVLAFAQLVPFNQCAITTQNLVAAGAATAGSACEIDVKDKGTVSVQVTGTYTGALSAQVTTNGATWVTMAPTPFAPFTAFATPTATIGSGATGIWQVSGISAVSRFRITALAAVTGTATVSIRAVDLAGGGGGGSSGGGAVTVADGANVVSGTTTDAAVGDANGTINSHVRQTAKYSSLIQSDTSRLTSSAGPKAPGSALATTAFMVGGTYNSGGVTLTNTQESGIQLDSAGNVKVSSTQLPAALGPTTKSGSLSVSKATDESYSTSANFTSGTTAYAAQDVAGGALTFSGICASGGRVMITSVALRVDSTGLISGQTSYMLHLYDATPPSAIADSSPWDLPAGDRANYLGSINLGTPVDLGSTLYVGTDGVNKQVKCASASTTLYGYLVSVGAYTPTAQVYTVQLHAIGL